MRPERLERLHDRLETLPVERGGIRFAPPFPPIPIHQPDPGALVAIRRATRDGEGVAGRDGCLLDDEPQSHRRFLSHHMMTADVSAITTSAPKNPYGLWVKGIWLKFMPKIPPMTISGSAIVATIESCFITVFKRFEVCERYVSSTPASRSRTVSIDSTMRIVWSYTSR